MSVRHLRRERWLGWLALVALWAAAIVPYLVEAHPAVLVCGTPFVLLAGTSVILGRNVGRSIAGTRPPGRPGTLCIDGEGITVQAGPVVRHLALRDIVSGWTEAGADFDDVVLQARSGEVVRVTPPAKTLPRT